MALTSRITYDLVSTLVGTHDFAAPSSKLTLTGQLDFASGTGADQADVLWSDQRTLAASATEDLDLSGSLSDALGTSVALARVKALFVQAATGNTNDVVLGNATTNAWATLLSATGTLTLKPGAFVLVGCEGATAWAVTAGTGDLLKVANSSSGSGVTYNIAIIGASA